MDIKIVLSNGYIMFGVSCSKYRSFADVIIAGYTDWSVDSSLVRAGNVPESPLDSGLLVEGWNTTSERIKVFLRRQIEKGSLSLAHQTQEIYLTRL
jgi:hypothetical protein